MSLVRIIGNLGRGDTKFSILSIGRICNLIFESSEGEKGIKSEKGIIPVVTSNSLKSPEIGSGRCRFSTPRPLPSPGQWDHRCKVLPMKCLRIKILNFCHIYEGITLW